MIDLRITSLLIRRRRTIASIAGNHRPLAADDL